MSDKIDEITVRKVAKLSRLEVSDQQVHKLASQLNSILDYVNKLNELDTADIEPLAHCLPVQNVMREDNIQQSLGTDKVLTNAPERDDNHFIVPKIIDEVTA